MGYIYIYIYRNRDDGRRGVNGEAVEEFMDPPLFMWRLTILLTAYIHVYVCVGGIAMDRRYVRVLIVSFISYNLKNFSEGNDSEETRVSMFFNFLKEDRTHGGGCYIALWFLQINLYFFFFFFS